MNLAEFKNEVYRLTDGLSQKMDAHIEITVTNKCNCNCQYCFEKTHEDVNNPEEEHLQLMLLSDFCKNFNRTRFNRLTITFWGGEPLLNLNFIKQIIDRTCDYDFVDYHMYTNGTLLDMMQELLDYDKFVSLKNRFHIQISYDGHPIHKIKRCDNESVVFQFADLLYSNNIKFDFKATITEDMIEYMPQAWDSYHQLQIKYPHCYYAPTLDTCAISGDKLDVWKKSLIEIAKKEFSFIRENRRSLMTWFNFNNDTKRCGINNTIHIHSDGNIYVCHGCPYLKNKEKFILGNTKDIISLNDVLKIRQTSPKRPIECLDCGAVACTVCHITQVDEDNIFSDWNLCVSKNKIRCQYYKLLGYIYKILKFSLVKASQSL